MDPNAYIIAGPNGAGKTTFAREFLPLYADCRHFINADLIAQGMSPFSPEAAAMRAGRLTLGEIERRRLNHDDFGFETTLSGRGCLNMIRRLKESGYHIHFFYLWVPLHLALSRIRDRVLDGGHNVPEADVRRRYRRSLRSFLSDHRPLANSWTPFNNSEQAPVVIASERYGELRIIQPETYGKLIEPYE